MQQLVEYAQDYADGLITLEEWHRKTVIWLVDMPEGSQEALAAYLKDYNVKRG